jgi:tetratricopeptide (TPR) repeat protein
MAGAYFKYDYLWRAEQCLDKMSTRAVRGDFYRGAIRLKQGDVMSGLSLLRAAAEKDPTLTGEMERIVQAVEDGWISAEGPETLLGIYKKRLIQMGPAERVLEMLWPKDVAVIDRIFAESATSSHRLPEADAIISLWEPASDRLPEWWTVKARRLSIQGRSDEGVAAVEKALQMNGERNPQWMALLARLLIESGRADEGIATLDEAVGMDSKAAVIWEEIGDALAAGNDYDGALAAYEKCLGALPDRLSVLTKIGDCYSAAGHAEAARLAYDQVRLRRGNLDGGENRSG